MKVLVLGGTRFFGKRLVNLLLDDGHEVVVATRGIEPLDFIGDVKHVKIDRTSREDVFRLAKEHFDVVYDNICFAPQEAMDSVEAFSGQNVRYVMTSSGSVYKPSGNLTESCFDPRGYAFDTDNTETLSYDEGKRRAETAFAQLANFPSVYVRFPIVLGVDDYSGRLQFHITKIDNKQPFYVPNPQTKIGFIRSDEAAEFLLWVGTKSNATGPINAASNGHLSLQRIFEIIKEVTNGEVVLSPDPEAPFSPFGWRQDFYLNNDLASQQGFRFQNLTEWLPDLVSQLANAAVDDSVATLADIEI